MEYVKLKDLTLSTQYGYTAEETSKTEGIYKYLRITDIVPYYVNFATVPYCTIPQNKVDQYLVHEGDVLIARTGATTGYNYVVPKDIENTIYASYLIRFKLNKSKILPSYLKYVLKSKTYYGFVNNYIGGSAQPGMNARVFGRFNIPLYPLPVQHRIASILSSYDNLIENNNRRINLLEQMAENLYKEWFVRFRFPGYEKVEMENGLPQGWKIAPLSSEFNTTSGGTPSRTNMNYYSGSIPWIKTGELQGTFILDTEEHITEEAVRKSSAKMIPAYSLLIAMYAGANVGNLGINSTPATCNQACCVITTKGRYPLYYLMFFLQTQKDFLQSISFGAAQQNISQDIIKKLKVIMPPYTLCETFNNLVSPYLHQCEMLMRQNQLLTRQRDLLLPRLMSGKLEVNA